MAMRDRFEPVLLKVMAIGTAALMVAALSAIVILGRPSPPAVSAMLPDRSSTSSTA